MLNYRVIKEKDFETVANIIHDQGGNVPNPQTFTAIIAEEDGEIVGLWGLELNLHAGPLWVKPFHRGKDLPSKMLDGINNVFFANCPQGFGYVVYGGHKGTDKACAQNGLEDTGCKVWKKVF